MGNTNINQTITAPTRFETITVANDKIKRTIVNLSKGSEKFLRHSFSTDLGYTLAQ